jgi:hypothetical protein
VEEEDDVASTTTPRVTIAATAADVAKDDFILCVLKKKNKA